MADFNFISVSDGSSTLYFTDTGLEDGDPCMTEVPDLDELNNQKFGAVQFSANKTPKIFSTPSVGQGFLCRIQAFVMASATHASLWAMFNGLDLEAGDDLTITINGEFGDFTFTAWPFLPKTTEAPGTFSEEWLDQVTYVFVVKQLVTP